MFDTAKVQRMTTELGQFAREHEEIYVVPEYLSGEAFALFRRFGVRIKAILSDNPSHKGAKKIFGVPVLTTEEASTQFNERTGIIILIQKPLPFIQTTFDFAINGQLVKISAFVIAFDEVLAIYDRITIIGILQQYKQDGLPTPALKDLAMKFSRGLTTFLDPTFQNFKFQLWDRRTCFNPHYDLNDTAIVMQGPISYENNYTSDTLKFYRKTYPNVPIVVSTWKGEATDDFRAECKKFSIFLLENDLPNPKGASNVNCQLKSSLQGVRYVQENTSAKFVLKTRTDQRINRFDFLLYFKNLLETFPPYGDKLQRRIIFLNSFKSRCMPFFFQDFLSFGHILDIAKLYDIPFYSDPGEMSYLYRHKQRRYEKVHAMFQHAGCPVDYDILPKEKRKFNNLNKMMRRFCNVEMYISRTFYKKHIAPIDENHLIETCWKFTRDYLILVDWSSIFFEWPKYEDYRRYEVFAYSGWTLNFARWLDMYRNFKTD